MGKYIGPKNKVARSLRRNIFGKPFEKKYTDGKTRLFHKRASRLTEYGRLLKTRKEVLLLYGMREKQLSRLARNITKKKGDPESALISSLERRLSNVVFRLGFQKTRATCRQLVSHKHITVNGEVVNVASALVKEGDVISIRAKDINNPNICDFSKCSPLVYKWLTFDENSKQGKVIATPTEEDVPEKKKWTDIIEIYSK